MNTAPVDEERAASRGGHAAAVAVVLLCAPSAVPYIVSDTSNVSQSDGLIAFGWLMAGLSPFAFVAALIVGGIAVARSRGGRGRVIMLVVLLLTLAVQISFWTRSHFL
jgi:hypothetical protein